MSVDPIDPRQPKSSQARLIAEAESAAESGDLHSIELAAHTLKSNFATLGASALMVSARTIEEKTAVARPKVSTRR